LRSPEARLAEIEIDERAQVALIVNDQDEAAKVAHELEPNRSIVVAV
jgi:hypothetical protein